MQDINYTEEEIRNMIDLYAPSQETVQTLNDNGLVIFVGVSGAGKNTIMDRLVATGDYYDAITSTTRLPRENDGVMEQDGVEYYFLSTKQAIENIHFGNYVEVSWVHDRINGMLAGELSKAAQSHKTTITDVDIQGALKYRNVSNKVHTVFIVPPSFEEWDARNRNRYKTSDHFNDAWPARKRSAMMELELALRHADEFTFVVNASVEDALDDINAILAGDINLEKQRVGREITAQILGALRQS